MSLLTSKLKSRNILCYTLFIMHAEFAKCKKLNVTMHLTDFSSCVPYKLHSNFLSNFILVQTRLQYGITYCLDNRPMRSQIQYEVLTEDRGRQYLKMTVTKTLVSM